MKTFDDSADDYSVWQYLYRSWQNSCVTACQLNNLVIAIRRDQTLIDEMFLKTGQNIFKGRVQYLNQVKTQGFRTFQFGNFQ